MSNKKVLFLAITAFIMGIMAAPSGKTEIKEVEKIVTESTCDNSTYDEIISTDTQLIDLLADGMGLAGEGFQAIADGNIEAITRITNEVNEMTPTASALRTKRDSLIEQVN